MSWKGAVIYPFLKTWQLYPKITRLSPDNYHGTPAAPRKSKRPYKGKRTKKGRSFTGTACNASK